MSKYNLYITGSISIIILCLIILVKIDAPQKAEQQRNIDYSQYIDKIWVTGNSLGELRFIDDLQSFYIRKIENGYIEGEYAYSIPTRVENPRYGHASFSGTVDYDTAICQFEIYDMYIGEGEVSNGTLRFKEDDRILMSIEYSENSLQSGDYLYRPYNLRDLGFQDMLAEKSLFPIDLDYGKEVSIAIIYVEEDYDAHLPHIYFLKTDFDAGFPYVYLIDNNEDILIHFDMPFGEGMEITATTAEDINRDGLKDIRLVANLTDVETRDFLFYQTESGGFTR